jgi:GH43 family beta-xylosidase
VEQRLPVDRVMRPPCAALCALLTLACGEGDPPGAGGNPGDGGGGTGDPDAAGQPVHGLRGVYYRQNYETVADRVDAAVDFDWGDGEPVAGAGTDRFAVRWTGELEVPQAGTWSFALDADDGVRLWLGSDRVIGSWRPQSLTTPWKDVELPAGRVPIKLTYFEQTGPARVTLRWRHPDGVEEVIPTAQLWADASGSETPSPAPPYQNPVMSQSCADPGVLHKDGWYYAVCTGGRFRIKRSRDLVIWQETDSYILPEGGPSWSASDSYRWAPELHPVGDTIVAYFTAADGDGQRAIGAAVADSPLGHYTVGSAPLLTNPIGVIDPSFFRDDSGKQYLLWKLAGNSSGQPTPIYLRELRADGLAFAPGSSAVELIRNDPSTFEGAVTEAPWLVKHDGTYYLFYSGNYIDENYRVGVARASAVKGPYSKHSGPILGNNATWVGPGHGAVTHAGDSDYFVYHAWHNDGSGGTGSGGRLLMVDRIRWKSDGWPAIGGGSPGTGLMARPTGDPDD